MRFSGEIFMARALVGLFLASALTLSACGSRKNPIAVEMDLYLHPEAGSLDDLILKAAVQKRLTEGEGQERRGLHVRVSEAVVTLSGSVASDAERQRVERLARETRVEINGAVIAVREVKSYLAVR
jgi:osmotically-inducible protein OsmY